jgi:CubicO group peptidase (beta-lactamase class C family)
LYHSLTDDDFKNDPVIRGKKSEFHPIQTYKEYLDYIVQLDFQLLDKPGAQWRYNNDCYGLLASIVERVSGQNYEDYITNHILKPAMMLHTSFFLDDLNGKMIAKQYVSRVQNGKSVIVASPNWWDTPILRAAGFLKSTVNDMLRFSEIFRTGGLIGDERILTNDSVRLMTEGHFASHPIVGQSYGYGVEVISHYHGTKMVGHPGGIKGGAAQMSIIPEEGLTGIVLSNFLSSAPTVFMNAAFNCMNNRLPEDSHVRHHENPVEEQFFSQYMGSYQSDSMNLSLSIELNGNQLQAQVFTSPITLNHIRKDVFLLKGTMDYVRFDRNAHNEIISMHYKGLKFLKN